MNTIEKIFNLMEKKHISANALSKALGFKNNVVFTQWKNGTSNPSADALSKIADYFDVSVDYLLGRTDLPQIRNEVPFNRLITMPVIGSISAGYDGHAEEEILDEYPVFEKAFHGYNKDDCFVLRVKGSSMYPDFHEGDYVLVHKQNSIDSGDIAIILYNGDEATLKKVEYKNGQDWLRLIPRNPEYETKTVKGSDLELCKVLGKVITIVYRENL